MTDNYTSSLIGKRFAEWKASLPAGKGYNAAEAWEAAWIASNDFTLSIVNAGKASEIPVKSPPLLVKAVIAEIDRLSAMKMDELTAQNDVGFMELLDMALTLRNEISPPTRESISLENLCAIAYHGRQEGRSTINGWAQSIDGQEAFGKLIR